MGYECRANYGTVAIIDDPWQCGVSTYDSSCSYYY